MHGSPTAEIRRSKPADWPWMLRHSKRVGDCLVWQRATNEDGYGILWNAGRGVRAHQVAWELTFGLIPAHLCVCHSCDNRPCIEPTHLWLGTQPENIADMIAKGRLVIPRGEHNGNAKLNDDAVRIIRSSGRSDSELAGFLGGTPAAIWFVRRGLNWRHVQ